MDILNIIVQQLLQMSIVVIFGFILGKSNLLNQKTQQDIAHILTKYVIPLTLVLAFQQPFNSEYTLGIIWALIGSVLIILSRILWAEFGFKHAGKIDRYATVFSNSIFVGIPIIFPILGYEGILYLSMYLVVSALFQYTYGIWNLSDRKLRMTFQDALVNPGIIGTLVGLVFYLFQLELPQVIFNSIDTIASLSSPLGMILLGGYLSRSRFNEVFFIWRNYWVISHRLIITPMIGFIILWFLPIENPNVFLTLAIANCTPIAINTAVFSQIYGGDYEYGARLVVLSSIFSLGTLPFLIGIAMSLF